MTKEAFSAITVGSSLSAIAPLAGASGASMKEQTLQGKNEELEF